MGKLSVEEMCKSLSWNVQDLARAASIAWPTARNAYEGREPAPRTKKDIVAAFSVALKREVSLGEIAWTKGE